MYEDEDLQEIHEDIQELDVDISVLRKDLNNVSASVNGSGENVTLSQTAEARFKKLNISGNNKQTQYSGKNKFNKDDTPIFYSFVEKIEIQNGIRSKIITNSQSSKFVYVVYPIADFENLLGQTVTLSAKVRPSAENLGRCALFSCNSSGVPQGMIGNLDETGSVTINISSSLPSAATQIGLVLYGNTSGTADVGDYVDYTDIQLEIGNSATTYEPYCGGLPSPNPSYPQEIRNAGILPIEYQQVEYIESTGTQYIDTDIVGRDGLKLITKLQIESYPTRNTPLIGSYGNSLRCYLPIINKDGKIGLAYRETIWSDTTISNQPNVLEINIEVNNQYLKLNDTLLISNKDSESLYTSRDIFIFGYNNLGSLDSFYPASFKLYYSKIYVGTSLVRDFIPCYRKSDNEIGLYDTVNSVFYTNQGTGTFLKGNNTNFIDIKVQNKNLFDKDAILLDRELNGTYGTIVSTSGWYVSDFIRVKPNTNYRLTKGVNGSSNCFYDINKKFIKTIIGASTVTSPNDDRVAYVRFNGVLTDLDISSIQFEENSTATSYTPHQEQSFTILCQQPMRGIGTTKDCFFKNVVGSEYYNAELVENAWYERHIIRHIELTNDNINTILSGSFVNVMSNINAIHILKSQLGWKTSWGANCLINKYNLKSGSDYYNGCFSPAVMGMYLSLFDQRFETVEIAKPLLIGTIIDIEQTTPTYLQCTQVQTEVLEAISKADSYSEQTNISSLGAVSPIYTVTAFRDMNATIENLQARIDLLNN